MKGARTLRSGALTMDLRENNESAGLPTRPVPYFKLAQYVGAGQRKGEESDRYLEDSHLAQMNHVFGSNPERYGVPSKGGYWRRL